MLFRNPEYPPMNEAKTFDPRTITRPDKKLRDYYFLIALFGGPAYPLVALPLWFKYETLKYRFDDEGVFMSWGILFRKEINLTYRRIQDIHLTRNLLQRWMGLATVSIQTAAGKATPEMSIEGILQAEELRDFLYHKMRGGSGETAHAEHSTAPQDEALALLREIRDTLKSAPGRGASS